MYLLFFERNFMICMLFCFFFVIFFVVVKFFWFWKVNRFGL